MQSPDHAADKVSFLALCKTAFNLDVLYSHSSSICLGKGLVNKHRPLLVCFAHEFDDDKTTVIFHSNLLHHHNQFEKVFIALNQGKI